MAVTVTRVSKESLGKHRVTITKVNIGAHVAGGVALTPAQLGLSGTKQPLYANCESAGGYIFQYDRTNAKIIAFKSNGTSALQDAGSVDLSAVNTYVLAIGQ